MMQQKENNRMHVYVLSRHPALPTLIKQTLAASLTADLNSRLSFPVPGDDPIFQQPCLFFMDVWSQGEEAIGTCRLLRTRCPGSKFVALSVAGEAERDQALRLLYAGFDGAVRITDGWCKELAEAIDVILDGRLWFPREIMSEYVKHTNLLLDNYLGRFLSGRENQVLQLAMRRLSNKEIGAALGISERTVRFHMSKIFAKLRIENRTALFKTINAAPITQLA